MSQSKTGAPWEGGDATPEPKLTWNYQRYQTQREGGLAKVGALTQQLVKYTHYRARHSMYVT